MSRARVVIVGIGFVGREAIKALAHQDVDMLVLDRHTYHTYHTYHTFYPVLAENAHPVESCKQCPPCRVESWPPGASES